MDILKEATLIDKFMEFGIKCVTVCACVWLLFVFYYIYILYDMTYVSNYFNMLRFIQVEFSRQRCLLSSCAQQTLWCKLQGTADGHIPLPKRQYQQVCHWQPMDRQNHPTTKRTFGKTHNYYCPLTRHKEFRFRLDSGVEMQQKKSHENQTIFVSAYLWQFL
jgi:hypothetical protein